MTNDSTDRQKNSRHHKWAVELDTKKCSLCEVCARHCPTGAIHLERKDDMVTLYFRHGKCDACSGEKSCEAICPEEAIKVIDLGKSSRRSGEVRLIQSKLQQCSRCREYFSPYIKLESLGKKGLSHGVEKSLCPICRRKKLVVKLIDEKTAPGGHAEYRSKTDIIRHARFKRYEDYKDES